MGEVPICTHICVNIVFCGEKWISIRPYFWKFGSYYIIGINESSYAIEYGIWKPWPPPRCKRSIVYCISSHSLLFCCILASLRSVQAEGATGWLQSIYLKSKEHFKLILSGPWTMSSFLKLDLQGLAITTLCSRHMDGKRKWKIFKHSFSLLCSEWVKVAQSCPTLCDPMDYTVHGILQARILEWIAFLFSRRSS